MIYMIGYIFKIKNHIEIFEHGIHVSSEFKMQLFAFKMEISILGQKSNGPLQTMDCKLRPVRPIFINCISHSSAASARQYWTNFSH